MLNLFQYQLIFHFMAAFISFGINKCLLLKWIGHSNFCTPRPLQSTCDLRFFNCFIVFWPFDRLRTRSTFCLCTKAKKNVFEYVCAPRILFSRSLLDRLIFFNHFQFDCARYVHGPSHLIRSELTNVLLNKINFLNQIRFWCVYGLCSVQFSSFDVYTIFESQNQNWRSMLLVADCLPFDLQLLG